MPQSERHDRMVTQYMHLTAPEAVSDALPTP
jgi:hypothetical protein